MKILVTGANGFVGNALCRTLVHSGHWVRGALRDAGGAVAGTAECVAVGPIGPDTDWSAALRDIDVVVHLAARNHFRGDRAAKQSLLFERVNYLATDALGRQAAAAGIRRLVFTSSVAVHGNQTTGRRISETDIPAPRDPYAAAKWNAEQALNILARENALEVVTLRPPLVYGPGVKGNLLRLMNAVAGGIPLPFASIDNHRSLLGIDNLVAAIMLCMSHPAASGNTYLASDGDVSTPQLVRLIANAMHRPARILPCPVPLLELAGKFTGNDAAVTRLVSSLQIDSAKIRRELGWRPVLPLAAGIARMAQWYDQQSNHHLRN